jgi:acyl-CoA thioester hydrolase
MSASETASTTGTQVLVHRRVAWNETDAAGHNHFSAAFRWIEEAEHDLYFGLGFDMSIIDRVPRVHIDIDYSARLYFNDSITVRVVVERVGTSSCTLAFQINKEGGPVAISGSYVIVHAASTTDGSAPWPADIRAALSSGQEIVVRTVLD